MWAGRRDAGSEDGERWRDMPGAWRDAYPHAQGLSSRLRSGLHPWGGMALPEELAMNDSRSRTRLLKKWMREDSGLQPSFFLAQEPLDRPCRREYQASHYPPVHGRQMDSPVVERQARDLTPFPSSTPLAGAGGSGG